MSISGIAPPLTAGIMVPMTINVKFFASMREYLDQSEVQVAAEPSDTVADIWQRVSSDKPMPPNTVCAVNHTQAKPEHPVRDGDEIAFFPPVTGG